MKYTETDKHKTVVIFRKIPRSLYGGEEEIIALFPEIPATHDTRTCLAYVHRGQHTAAMASGHGWKLATPQEYNLLRRELVGIGYNLDIRKRSCPTYFRKREEAIQ